MSITNLGKKEYIILRDSQELGTGERVNGEWIAATRFEVPIIANIQPNTASYRTQLLPVGDREKEALNIYSNDWLYVARSGLDPLECDIVLYRGAKWEVVVVKPYNNFGEHCEAMAVKIDDSVIPRFEGNMSNGGSRPDCEDDIELAKDILDFKAALDSALK